MIEIRGGSFPKLTSLQLAAVIVELAERGDLEGVLDAGLDRYARARLYAVATSALGRPIGPDPHHYCPWCDAEYARELGFAAHLEIAHPAMVGAP